MPITESDVDKHLTGVKTVKIIINQMDSIPIPEAFVQEVNIIRDEGVIICQELI